VDAQVVRAAEPAGKGVEAVPIESHNTWAAQVNDSITRRCFKALHLLSESVVLYLPLHLPRYLRCPFPHTLHGTAEEISCNGSDALDGVVPPRD